LSRGFPTITLGAHGQCKPTKLTTFFLLLQCVTAVAILAPMRFSVKRLRAITALFAVVQALAVAPPITADDEPNGPELIAGAVDELDRWVPAVSIDMGLMIQETTAGFLTGGIKDPAWVQAFPASRRIRQSASGNSRPFAPVSTLSLEFMTPGIPYIPTRPRMFVHGEVIATFPHSFRTAKNGDVNDFTLGFPPNASGNTAGNNTEQVIGGQGGTLKSKLQRWQFAGGAGIAFTADLRGRRIRVKPSFEYLTQEIEVSGLIKRATAIIDRPRGFDDLRLITLNASKTKRYHGMGAGMELEMDTRRSGPLLVSMFANVRVYRFMGDLKVNLKAKNSFDEEAKFRFELKRYTYRTAIGIRFRFAPE
jgi:hypothetical protein